MKTLPERLWSCIDAHLSTCASDEEIGRFNPWYSTNPDLDRPNAAALRRENLRRYLNIFKSRPCSMAVGEAPGWRGCRFSGVPFTSEVQFNGDCLPFAGETTSLASVPWWEHTANVFWSATSRYARDVFAWNAYPLHPHEPGIPASNRKPSRSELETFWPLLEDLREILRPRIIVAVGKVAEELMQRHGWNVEYVRHPARGGEGQFRAGVERIERSCRQSRIP